MSRGEGYYALDEPRVPDSVMAPHDSSPPPSSRMMRAGASDPGRPFGAAGLRIPPLQNHAPLPSLMPSGRPRPMEPSAAMQSAGSRTKLAARPKAASDSTSSAASSSTETEGPAGSEGSRKRAKTDMLHHLPQRQDRDLAPSAFRQLPLLSGLSDIPPPNAGFLPPISPAMLDEPRMDPFAHPQMAPASSTGSSSPTGSSPPSSGPKAKAKRQCFRGRLKWTDSETNDLLLGVNRYGVGKWKKILMDPDFKFLQERTMVDLKDRYRTCRMNEEKARERARADHMSGSVSPTELQRPAWPVAGAPAQQPAAAMGAEPVFDVTTPSGYKESLQSPKAKRGANIHPWTPAEDAQLSAGYSRYGFQWTAIAKDGELQLGHRTGAQVRDRFRMKWPEIYSSPTPLPLPGSSLPAPQVRRKSVQASAKGKDRAQLSFIMQHPKNTLPPLQPPTAGQARDQAGTPLTPGVPLPDRFSGLHMGGSAHSCEPELDDGSSGPVSPETMDPEHSEQSAADADEARHLSILGLLNPDDSQHNTLPPLEFSYSDDWEPPADSGVTLPPLSKWDDSQKGMYDLE